MARLPRLPLVITSALLTGFFSAAAAPNPPQTPPALVEIQRWAASGLDPFGRTVSVDERASMETLYADGGLPLWIDRNGRAKESAKEALAILARAASHGLEPADYDAEPLRTRLAPLDRGEGLGTAARFEVGVSLNLLRYLHDVHRGRVDPRAVGFRVDAPARDIDLATAIRTSVAEHRLEVLAEGLAPQFDQYAQLREALARYRMIDEPGDSELRLPQRIVREGDWLPADRLLERLMALGDIPETSAVAQHDVYRQPLVDGIARFQRRHGLQPDGVIGPQTRAALEVPISERVRQLELALERLRWLPPLGNGPAIALNVPMFRLWGWNTTPSNVVAISMNAIVGRALKTETPIFVGDMRYVVFRPYWNVPPSILKKELLPLILRDPAYLEREEFEIVRGLGEAVEVLPATPASLRLLRTGSARLRQRPGARNPLGLVEFLFPNAANVYLHGTPMPELFARTRRDFSHGCIRIEDPIALAEWVLQGQDEWTREAIVAATAGPDTVRIDLMRPVRVVIFYMTAAVMPDDGTVHFAADIYGHDETLARALEVLGVQRSRRRSPAPCAHPAPEFP